MIKRFKSALIMSLLVLPSIAFAAPQSNGDHVVGDSLRFLSGLPQEAVTGSVH
jgi:hypothetical protein